MKSPLSQISYELLSSNSVSEEETPSQEKGGTELDGETYRRECLRADIAEVVSSCCLEHSKKIADRLITKFDISKKARY